jgi:hypothetical protein
MKPTGDQVLLIGMAVALTVIVGPALEVLRERAKETEELSQQLEKRTAFLCQERAKKIELSNPEGGKIPVTVLPEGCDKYSSIKDRK